MATQSKIIYLPRLTANDSVKLISVICWLAKKCPCITEKKKSSSHSPQESISAGSQNYSDLWNLSHFCWQHFAHRRAGSPASIPRHLAHLPSGSLPCCRPHSLLKGDREVKMLHLGQRTCSLGSTYGPQHHNLYSSKSLLDNIPGRGLQDLLSSLQEKANLPWL